MLNMRHMILTMNNLVFIPGVLFNGGPLCHLLSSYWVTIHRVGAKVTWNDFLWLNIECQVTFTPILYFLPMSQQPLVGQSLLIVEVSRSHSDTPHSFGLLLTNDQLVAQSNTCQHTTLKKIHPCSRRDSNPQSQEAIGRGLTPDTALSMGSTYSVCTVGL